MIDKPTFNIFYFSTTGSICWASEHIAKELTKHGFRFLHAHIFYTLLNGGDL